MISDWKDMIRTQTSSSRSLFEKKYRRAIIFSQWRAFGPEARAGSQVDSPLGLIPRSLPWLGRMEVGRDELFRGAQASRLLCSASRRTPSG
jgi:hypothetical protein